MSNTVSRLQSWLGGLQPDTLLGASVLFVIFLIAGTIVSFVLRRAVRELIARDRDRRIDRMTASFLSRFTSLFVWTFALMLYAHTVPVLDRLGTALLASVSIASIVIGLAAQSTLSNLIAGIALIFYKPFRLGDRVQINAPTGVETGVVEDLSLGYTVLQTFDNRRIIVSNSQIANATMVNLTSGHPRVIAQVPFSIGYGADIDRARAIAIEIAGANDNVEEIVDCPVVLLAGSSVDMKLRFWCADAGVAAQATYEVTEAIKKRFDLEGIEIPFAYTNVILHRPSASAADEAKQIEEENRQQKRKH